MARCLDTSFLIDLLRGHEGALGKARSFDERGEALFIPAPSLAEFLDGAHYSGGVYLTKALELVAGRDVLALDDSASELAGRLSAELRRRGQALSLLDVMIASITLRGHHVLVTRDSGFSRVPGLAVESY